MAEQRLDGMLRAEHGFLEKDPWHEITECFKDANLYQTWAYDVVKYGRPSVSHMVLRKAGSVVAAAQVRLYRLPLLGSGIAYLFWGPLWRLKNLSDDEDVFSQAMRSLRNEYCQRRGFVLRVYPQMYRPESEWAHAILDREGYHLKNDEKARRTLIMDLGPSLDELRVALEQKWRNCLNRAERNGLHIILGEDEALFDEFRGIYSEMAERKDLSEISDINYLKTVQRDLPVPLKLKVVLCRLNGTLCAGGIFSACGEKGLYLCGATSNAGMKTNGSYLVQWTFVKWLKDNGYRYYDLNGINPTENPGTYRFKHGLAGKFSGDVELIGKYESPGSLLSSLAVGGGEGLRQGYRRLRESGITMLGSRKRIGTSDMDVEAKPRAAS